MRGDLCTSGQSLRNRAASQFGIRIVSNDTSQSTLRQESRTNLVRPLEIAKVTRRRPVGVREPGGKARRAAGRMRASAPSIRLDGSAALSNFVESGRAIGVARLRGLPSDGALHQAFGLAFQLKSRVLMRLAARNRGDAPHEIKDALCRAADYAEQPVE